MARALLIAAGAILSGEFGRLWRQIVRGFGWGLGRDAASDARRARKWR